VEIQWV